MSFCLSVGARLGPYEILSPLGAGGMGEVYKARDTRLDRTVAIKILPSDLARDPDLRARFEREARAIAALDHPHICAIYDVGETARPEPAADAATPAPLRFLVMQFLDGETLAVRLARTKGPLPLDRALKIALEIADAIDKAHRAGITHRDLKPANIMLTKSGASLLDFGLAKLRGPVAPISMSGMTRLATATPDTAHGTILGTVHYMAPEQVEGREADARADIWALGVVLYEMLTGQRPFDGESPASVIGAILKDTPPAIRSRQPLTPAFLDHVVTRCLAKDPEARWQTARDLGLELQAVESVSSAATSGAPIVRRMKPLTVAAIVGAAVACAAVATWLAIRTARSRADAPLIEHAGRITNENGSTEWPAWSPDGTLFAFASNRSGNFEIYVRRVEAGQDVNVTTNAADDVQPAFSPDGTSIAFVSTRSARTRLIKIGTFIGFDTRTYGGDVWVMPALGGQARRVAEDGNFPVWHPTGRRLAYVGGFENHHSIIVVSIDGGAPRAILPPAASNWEITRIQYSPDGRWLTFETADRQVFEMPADGGTPSELFRGSSHTWDPNARRIYYINAESGGTRIEAVDLDSGPKGLTVTRASMLGVGTGILKDLAIAGDRARLLATGVEASLNLTRLSLTPDGSDAAGSEEAMSRGQLRDRYPAVSPDGKRIAVGSNRVGEEELWIVDVATRQYDRVQVLPRAGAWITQACWGKDNRHLAVLRFFPDGTSELWYVALDGSSTEQLVPPMPAMTGNFSCEFSPDGRQLVYAHRVGGFSQLFVMDMATRRERQLTTSPSDKYEASWSPDGSWLAFAANTGGAVQAWRIPAAGGGELQLTTGYDRYRHVFYSPNGRWLYVQPNHLNILRMPASGGPLTPVTHFAEDASLFLEEPTISPDGRWLVYNRGGGGSSLWLLTVRQP